MSMRWSMGGVRIRWRLAAVSGGNCIEAEWRVIGRLAALSRRSSVAAQQRLFVPERLSILAVAPRDSLGFRAATYREAALVDSPQPSGRLQGSPADPHSPRRGRRIPKLGVAIQSRSPVDPERSRFAHGRDTSHLRPQISAKVSLPF